MKKFNLKIISCNAAFIILITALVFFCYYNTFSFEFINFDDPIYVTDNVNVKEGITFESLKWAFEIHSDICMYYQPVAWISHMLDVEFWGTDPGAHHRTSVIIHILNTVLLFLVVQQMTGSFAGSAITASFFALHPVNVDSVCWIAERKTLVSAFFWFLAMGSYISYTKKSQLKKYIPVALFFTLGLFTKPVMITMPCALVLIDIWPLKRLERFDFKTIFNLVAEKIPLFIITGLWFITPFLSHTLLANETTTDVIPMSLRISNALVSYVQYIIKFFVPVNLSILYPYPSHVPLSKSLPSFFILSAITAYVVFQVKKRPYLFTGWFWFLGVLFPTSGLILGTLWPAMADRWAYIPYTGIAVMIAFSVSSLSAASDTEKSKNRPFGFFLRAHHVHYFLMACVIVLLAVFTFKTKKQVGYWKNSETVFKKALTVSGYHYLPHLNIAVELMKKERHEEARLHLETILSEEPDNIDATFNTGLSFYETGNFDRAAFYMLKAIELSPEKPNAYIVTSWIYQKENKLHDAIYICETALENVKNKNDVLYELAYLFFLSGKKEASEQKLVELLTISPGHLKGMTLYADIISERGETDKARLIYMKVLHHDPENTAAVEGLARYRNHEP